MSERKAERDRVAAAVSRLERAVDDLVSVAGHRAADYVERATDHLQRPDADRGGRAREPAWLWSDRPRSRTLYRDTRNGKLLGVCAGVARYYGIETWVIRCLAITGLIFFNWVTLVTYVVAAIILDKRPKRDERPADGAAARRDHERRRARSGRRGRAPDAKQAPAVKQALRAVQADFDQVESRLRRMESHVTSGQYDLRRELARIEDRA